MNKLFIFLSTFYVLIFEVFRFYHPDSRHLCMLVEQAERKVHSPMDGMLSNALQGPAREPALPDEMVGRVVVQMWTERPGVS
jgi:hypothetical protein